MTSPQGLPQSILQELSDLQGALAIALARTQASHDPALAVSLVCTRNALSIVEHCRTERTQLGALHYALDRAQAVRAPDKWVARIRALYRAALERSKP